MLASEEMEMLAEVAPGKLDFMIGLGKKLRTNSTPSFKST